MFGIVLTTVYALMLSLLAFRAAYVPWIRRRLGRRGIVLVALALLGIFVLGRVWGHGADGPLAGAVEFAGMSLLGWALLSMVAMTAVEVVTLFGFLFRRALPWLRGGALVLGTLLSLVALVQGLRAPVVETHEVTIPDLPPALDGLVVVAVSDTHVGGQLDADWFTERLHQMRGLEPDLVLFLGDIFEGHGEVPGEIPALAELQPRLGGWFVEGNHDTPRHGRKDHLQVLERAGLRRLSNRCVQAAPGLAIAGVRDLTRLRRRGQEPGTLTETLATCPPGPVVLLSHSPLGVEEAASAGAALMLSGHTHAGQIWPFEYLVKLFYPYTSGRYQVGEMSLIVSRGAGLWGPRMRLWLPGDILRIRLRSAGVPVQKLVSQ